MRIVYTTIFIQQAGCFQSPPRPPLLFTDEANNPFVPDLWLPRQPMTCSGRGRALVAIKLSLSPASALDEFALGAK